MSSARAGSIREQAAKAAQKARVVVGAEADGGPLIPNLLSLIEQNGDDPVPVALLPLPPGVAGAYIRREGRPFIFVSSSTWPARRRFTIAHEYGHHVLGHRPKIDTEADLYDETTEIEIAANAFAAEFLAPANAVRRWIAAQASDTQGSVSPETLVRLAHFFGISAESALYRAVAAGLLTSQQSRRQLEELIKSERHKGVARRLGLADPVGSSGRDDVGQIELNARRQPSLVTDQILTIAGEGLLQPRRISELLDLPLADLEALFVERGVELPSEDDETEF